ncbi:transcriptional regulator [Streptomyces venezuelae]|uniref:Transcriptional regulator n=1 Tax=Streptomyces venezuelae TaxID=54571 RepID=A0A5P2C6S5_STRVZ|nr:helix-turn-helix domain-containing protein [Streptomyces venezuelae]QES38273.1 transcriptional regulator [Streptomyces venezuelae]
MTTSLPPITRMLRTWRKRQDPRAVPGFTERYGKRNRKGLTQADMALLTGMSEGWYRKLETGAQENYSHDVLDRVARILGLNDAERVHLFYFATGHEPAPLKRPDAGHLDPTVTALVHQQIWPAYTFGPDWDIRVFNEHAGRDFPWMNRGVNVMIWALTYPEARLQLIEWEESWAKPMASQLRLAAQANQGNQRLAEVVREVKERDPVAKKILEEDHTAITHPDGDVRRLHLPNRDGVFEVEFITFARLRNNTKMMIVMPPGDAAYRQANSAMPSTMASVPAGTPGAPASA